MATVTSGGSTRVAVVHDAGTGVHVVAVPVEARAVEAKAEVRTASGPGVQGPPGPEGPPGPQGEPGAAQIPDILDGGNF